MEIGETVENRFKVEGKIGEGGQSDVYLVSDKNDSGAHYALKELNFRLDSSVDLIRFKREVEVLKKIDCSQLIKVISEEIPDKPEENRKIYYIMEHAKYGTLYNNNFYSKEVGLCLKLFRNICLGVKALHDQDILHRDLKPSNILLLNDQKDVRVSDLGLAYDLDKDNEEVTKAREKVGSIYFCAPEQTSLPPNPQKQSDIFSLGRILFFMLTGEKRDPYSDLSLKDLITHKDVGRVEQLIKKMCEPDPKDRFADVSDVIKEIDKILKVPSSQNVLELTLLQLRILKHIRSFGSDSTSFESIFYDMEPRYNVGEFSIYDLASDAPPKISRSKLVKAIENSLDFLGEKGLIEFENASYRYKKSDFSEQLLGRRNL
ncbi:protein kinase [Candidatus Micrarchaeota archaeon]|nr:protein kinase [Candidatus Micrarchaeota archaeon]